jgi:glutamate synthase (NADPH/NADH) small chain
VAIGSLERFAADFGADVRAGDYPVPQGPRVALVGSGPASLVAAHVAKGCHCFRSLSRARRSSDIRLPGFSLPRDAVRDEIAWLQRLGVEFRTEFLVGQTWSIDELFVQGVRSGLLGHRRRSALPDGDSG